jgi:DNA-damage-inducible protein J
MTKTATVRARIEPTVKDKAERVFSALGLSATEAIRLFYRQVDLHQGLPFQLEVPNELTAQTLDDTDAGRNLVTCSDADELFAKLDM